MVAEKAITLKRETVLPIILVINLDRDKIRMDTVASNLKSLGLTYQRVPAIMGKDLPNPDSFVDLVRYPRNNHADKPRAGEIGCYLSHITAMRQLLDSDRSYALILEDDVELLPEAKGCLEALVERDDWDIVKLFCFHRGSPIRLAEIVPGRHLCVHLSRTTSTAAYLINRKAAERLTHSLLPMYEQIDHAFDRPWETGLHIRGIRPLVARLAETSLASSIEANSGSKISHNNTIKKRSWKLLAPRTYKELRRFIWGVWEIIRVKLF